MSRLAGKRAFITGAAGGIGLATAELFVAEGARVHLVDLAGDRLDAVTARLGEAATASAADVTDPRDVEASVAAAVEALGGLDIVVSNAGISGPNAPITDYPVDEFRHVLDVHVVGAFTVLQHTLPHVSAGGSVIITSSVTGLIGVPSLSGYSTAKHAQIGLMRSAAGEVAARGIRVNTINPGPVDNEFQSAIERQATGLQTPQARAAFDEQIPLGRHSTTREIAEGMVYLASDASAMVTSTVFRIDGGMAG